VDRNVEKSKKDEEKKSEKIEKKNRPLFIRKQLRDREIGSSLLLRIDVSSYPLGLQL